MKSLNPLIAGLLAILSPVAISLAADAPAKASREAADFFESQVRPILVEHCFACHGEKKQKGNLRLDSLEAMRKGNENGPAVIAGKPNDSPLVRAIHYDGDVKMPPKGKLSEKDIAALTQWVKDGAHWPEAQSSTGNVKGNFSQSMDGIAKTHWAFQPIKTQPLPAVMNATWPTSPVDHFILAKLEAGDLAPAPPADRQTLIRRATYNLIGLPPTHEEIEAFVADRSPDAFAKVVDRLLASPHYGERWGRHWLDVARYADTKGYLPGNVELRYPYSYTYRDYVIKAFNDDLPYDQFIVHQLAADQLPLGKDKGPLAAMGFLTLGRRFLNNPHDIIDDRIDVVTRGLLGLTVSCARCHDHKYDPIPTKDYYSLYGVFGASMEPAELPLIAPPEQTEAYQVFEKELKVKEKAVADFRAAKHHELTRKLRGKWGDYLLAVRAGSRLPGEDRNLLQAPEDNNAALVRRVRSYLDATRKNHHPILAAWHEFAAVPLNEFAGKAAEITARVAANADSQKRFNSAVSKVFAQKPPVSLQEVATRYDELFAAVNKQSEEVQRAGSAALPDADAEAIRQFLQSADSPLNVPLDQFERFLDRATRDRLRGLQREVERFKVNSPAAPPRAMVLNDLPNPTSGQYVFVRGNAGNWGERVPRRFLEVLVGQDRPPFSKGSGRLELAQAIASQANPVTARVLVNRVWLYHFGHGLVRTPSDFGTRGEPPTHPELLDYLANRFMDEGWSIKKLHRSIMLSSVYQQSSDSLSPTRERGEKEDPENRVLWKMNRRRLDFEALRDSFLAVAGNLDRTAGGRPVALGTRPFSTRRTVYGFIDRQNLPSMLRAFDFANPDATSPQRYQTTVPQQALFLMNSPFVVEQAQKLLSQPGVANLERSEQRIQQLHRTIFGRSAEPDEVALGLRFVNGTNAWEQYAQVLLLSNEFAFVD